MANILVVDDDEDICSAFRQFLSEEGHTPIIAGNAEDALKSVEDSHPDLVLMDIRMPGTDGLEALRRIRQVDPNVYVVIMTAYGTSQTSIEAMRLGAYDYLTKPLDLDVVNSLISKALEAQAVSRKVAAEPSGEWEKYSLVNLVGKSPMMQEDYKLIGLFAANDVPALLIGERGVGKHLVAKTIHFNSDRKDKPFVALHCRALPEEALGAELFGRETVAQGADAMVSGGKLESAHGGTLLLDDIDLLSLPLQARLLRFLMEKSFERLGGTTNVRVETRIVAATERNLGDNVRQGTFNEALFDRLRVLSIQLPPLRERRDDIPELTSHFIRRYNAELRKNIKGVEDRVTKLFLKHDWPGNVGALENVLQRAAVHARSDVITVADVGDSLKDAAYPRLEEARTALQSAAQKTLGERLKSVSTGTTGSPFHSVVGDVEKALIQEALALTSGNQVKAAELLGLNRTTLRKKMQLYGLDKS